MRDPDLVVRAQRAAAALELSWNRWRQGNGDGSAPLPPISSYVGYSLEEPWGQPRVVFGIDAEEAEQLAELLDQQDSDGSVTGAGPAAAPAGRGPELPGQTDRPRPAGPADATGAAISSGTAGSPGAGTSAGPGGSAGAGGGPGAAVPWAAAATPGTAGSGAGRSSGTVHVPAQSGPGAARNEAGEHRSNSQPADSPDSLDPAAVVDADAAAVSSGQPGAELSAGHNAPVFRQASRAHKARAAATAPATAEAAPALTQAQAPAQSAGAQSAGTQDSPAQDGTAQPAGAQPAGARPAGARPAGARPAAEVRPVSPAAEGDPTVEAPAASAGNQQPAGSGALAGTDPATGTGSPAAAAAAAARPSPNAQDAEQARQGLKTQQSLKAPGNSKGVASPKVQDSSKAQGKSKTPSGPQAQDGSRAQNGTVLVTSPAAPAAGTTTGSTTGTTTAVPDPAAVPGRSTVPGPGTAGSPAPSARAAWQAPDAPGARGTAWDSPAWAASAPASSFGPPSARLAGSHAGGRGTPEPSADPLVPAGSGYPGRLAERAEPGVVTLPARPEQAAAAGQEAAVGLLLEDRDRPAAERQQAGYPVGTPRRPGASAPALARLTWQTRAAWVPEPDPAAPRSAAPRSAVLPGAALPGAALSAAADSTAGTGDRRTLASMAAEAARWAAAAEAGRSRTGEPAG